MPRERHAELFSRCCSWLRPGGLLLFTVESLATHDTVGEWLGDWFRTFDSDYRFEMEETRNWGDRVLVVVTHNTRGRASGVPVTLRGAWIFRLLGGKIVRFDAYADRAEALQAAGLSE